MANNNHRSERTQHSLEQHDRPLAPDLAAIFDHIPAGLAIYDTGPAFRCVRHNARFLDLLGSEWRERGSVVDVPLQDLFDPASYEKTRRIFEQVTATNQVFTTDEYAAVLPPDPRPRYYQWSLTPLRDGECVTSLLVSAVEITALKQARAEESRLTRILASSSDFIGMADTQGRTIYLNPAGRALLGLGNDDDLAGRPIASYHAPWARKRLECEALPVALRDGFWRGESALLRPDGSEVPISQIIMAHRDSEGAIEFLSTIARDISERTAAEQALRTSEANLRAIFNNAMQSFVLLDRDDRIVTWNPLAEARARALYGKPLVVGAPMCEFTPPAYVEELRDVLERAHRGEASHVVRNLGSADAPRWYAYDYLPATDADGQVIAICVSVLEITEQRMAADALARSESRFRALVQNASDIILIVDLDGVIRYATPAVTAALGYPVEQFVGTRLPDIIHEEDLETVRSTRQSLLENNAELGLTTARFRRADGTWAWLETIGTNMIDHPGVRGIVINARDITARRRLEAQFLQAQKMEGIGRLAGGVAHDFNNLLTAITGYASFIGETLPPDHPVLADLHEIQKAADRAASLTRQLLAFARKQILDPQICSLNDLILDMDRLLRRLIGEDIELETLPGAELWPVKIDSGQIEQLLVNLAVNARDAMPNGGKLTIETDNVVLDEDYARTHSGVTPGDYVLLAVSDTGIGMDEHVQQHLFEPFYTTKTPDKGSGLGLATCYGIVQQHGGHIWFYSEVGLGTTFKIYLPRGGDARASAAAEAPAEPMHGDETILLVEDDNAVRSLAARALREHGYHVIEAGSGAEALRIAGNEEAGPIDLLLTDVIMPRMSGRQIAAAIGKLRPSVRVLYMSGYTDNAIIHHGRLEAGIVFIQKPFTPAALMRKVRQVLESESPPPAG